LCKVARRPASGADPGKPSLSSAVDLYWLPLGAGGRSVRFNGRAFEAVVARVERRSRCDLYHSALQVNVPAGRFVIEMAPIADGNGTARGVTAEGPVGSRWARSLRIFRYEVRRWRDGMIPDVDEAVASPQRLTDDPLLAQRVLDLVSAVPTPVWGRDELQAGEMWNSNSLTSWLIARGGLQVDAAHLPPVGVLRVGTLAWSWPDWTRATLHATASVAHARARPQVAGDDADTCACVGRRAARAASGGLEPKIVCNAFAR
jgi:hypothetical protein